VVRHDSHATAAGQLCLAAGPRRACAVGSV
jgi:hypothetical protein